jgi:hypothetical protein
MSRSSWLDATLPRFVKQVWPCSTSAIAVAGDVAGKAAFEHADCPAFGSTASDALAGGRLGLDPALDQGVQCVVEPTVAAAAARCTHLGASP